MNMFSKFFKITVITAVCLLLFPVASFAEEVTNASLSEKMNVSLGISATSSSGVEIPAYYDKTTNKHYLFMFQSDSRQLPVTYVGADGKKVTETISFASSDEAVLKNTQVGAVTVVFKQSKIPSLSITLNGTTLDSIHADKNVKYEGNSVLIDDATGGTSLTAENVEIKGRGNSSWTEFDKKGYQIKFDKKTSILGMDKAKKWVLIPNASDDSLLRNKIAYSLAEKLGMKNSLECRFVDLWIDGDYRGNYLVSEKVEIGTNRLNLTDDDGILLEWDEAFYPDEDFFENTALGTKFAVKETVNEDPTHVEQLKTKTNDSLTQFANYLLKTPVNQIKISKLNEYIDFESFVQYYLINEYMHNRESIITSFFWYKDGALDVFHLGPVWDFDSSLNFYGGADEYYVYLRNIFDAFLKAPETRSYIQSYYQKNKATFDSLSTLTKTEASKIKESANMDWVRWDVANLAGKTGYVNNKTWDAAVNTTVSWLQKRSSVFSLPVLSQEMHRLYNPYTGEHFYTADVNEKNYLVKIGWKYEDIGWVAPTSGTPVYRLYNPYSGDHHFTISEDEYNYLGSIGWTQEGIGWYSDDYQRTPLYRQFNPYETIGTHNYTVSKQENDYLATIGWKAEGIAWYGL